MANPGQRTGIGIEKYREFSSFSGFVWDFLTGLRSRPFRAADEKIPLSVVLVNNKPQYLVFSSHFEHPLSKHRQLPVESSKAPCGARVSGVDLPQSQCRLGAAGRPTFISKAIRRRGWVQGAKTVHFGWLICADVEIRGRILEERFTARSATWRESSADAEHAQYEFRPASIDKKTTCLPASKRCNPVWIASQDLPMEGFLARS